MWPFKKKQPEEMDLLAYWGSLDIDKWEKEARKLRTYEERRLALINLNIERERRGLPKVEIY